MEIKVGEYVRTECGIAKIKEISIRNEEYELDKDIMYIHQENYLHTCTKSQILKHSFNIIDLIEKGDIVNGFTVEEFDDEDGNVYLGIPIYDDAQLDCIEEVRPIDTIQIKTILTHEQYNRNCYTVKEEE